MGRISVETVQFRLVGVGSIVAVHAVLAVGEGKVVGNDLICMSLAKIGAKSTSLDF